MRTVDQTWLVDNSAFQRESRRYNDAGSWCYIYIYHRYFVGCVLC